MCKVFLCVTLLFFMWYLHNYSHQHLKERHVLIILMMYGLFSTTLILLLHIKNKLIVNTDKTEAMLIIAKPFIGPLRKLSFRNDNIKFVNVSCSLGVYINSQLKWD